MVATLGRGEPEHWSIVVVVVERDGSLVLVAEPTRQAVRCPDCGQLTQRQHSSYQRRPLDLPWRGYTVRLRVHSRRWFCDVPDYARRTDTSTELLTSFAVQAGGEGGARKAGMPVSPDTLLRIVRTLADTEDNRGSRVLGVDDVALRRKRGRFGTLLIDLETHRPIAPVHMPKVASKAHRRRFRRRIGFISRRTLALPLTRCSALVDVTWSTLLSPRIRRPTAQRQQRRSNRIRPSDARIATRAGMRCASGGPPGTATIALNVNLACTGEPSAATWHRQLRRATAHASIRDQAD